MFVSEFLARDLKVDSTAILNLFLKLFYIHFYWLISAPSSHSFSCVVYQNCKIFTTMYSQSRLSMMAFIFTEEQFSDIIGFHLNSKKSPFWNLTKKLICHYNKLKKQICLFFIAFCIGFYRNQCFNDCTTDSNMFWCQNNLWNINASYFKLEK